MEDFILGLIIGVLVTAIIFIPFITYFGIIYINLTRMEKRLSKQQNVIPHDTDTEFAIKQAEKILADRCKEITVVV